MKIESVYDASFKPYGQVLTGYNAKELVTSMEAIPLPETGVAYETSIASLETNAIFGQLQNNAYGGMPIQIVPAKCRIGFHPRPRRLRPARLQFLLRFPYSADSKRSL